jgi:hypothetical protein
MASSLGHCGQWEILGFMAKCEGVMMLMATTGIGKRKRREFVVNFSVSCCGFLNNLIG